MAFGQAAGPPAPARRVAELADLLAERGYDSFKEARHPFGLTQRQAAGKFTVAEVEELLERLEAGEDGPPEATPVRKVPTARPRPDGARPKPTARPKASPRATAAARAVTAPGSGDRKRRDDEELVTGIDAEVLATELVNRGWCCIAPPDGTDGLAPPG